MKILCKHFNLCGGCSLQNLSYEEQLAKKQKTVENYLKHFDTKNINQIIPSNSITYFRNKMEYVWGRSENGEILIGMRKIGRFDKIVNIEECLLLSESSNKILQIFREWAYENNLSTYNLKTHKGFLRYLTIKEAKNTNQTLIYLVTYPPENTEQIEKIKEIAKYMQNEFQNIKTFVWATSTRKSDVATGETQQILFGEGVIYEKLMDFKFRISPLTFFQTNPKTAESLYTYIHSMLSTQKNTTALDLYCGPGTISIFIHDLYEKIIGIDSDYNSISDALENLKLNDVKNCEFICSTTEEFVHRLLFSKFHVKLTTVVLDPPRAGVGKKVILNLIRLNPNRIIYVSCNLKALVNDLIHLSKFYKIDEVQPIDLFPHTEHVETVLTLTQK